MSHCMSRKVRATIATVTLSVGVLSCLVGGTASDSNANPLFDQFVARASVFARFETPIAGVAGGKDVVFVGEPLNGRVVALARADGRVLGELPPPPPLGFAVPFILHTIHEGTLAVLDAGGLPQPAPFMPANPRIYEYTYTYNQTATFSATLVRTVSFDTAVIGFAEDFVRLDDGRFLLSDAVLGSLWIAEPCLRSGFPGPGYPIGGCPGKAAPLGEDTSPDRHSKSAETPLTAFSALFRVTNCSKTGSYNECRGSADSADM